MEETQQHLLGDIITETDLVQAGTGKRFANFLIDYLIFLALVFCIGIIWAIVSPETVRALSAGNNTAFSIIDRIISLILYGFFMSVIEAITKGRSVGKFITNTKAVNEDGSNITTSTAFKRGFSRVVPFEVLSAFGSPSYPWHDKWNQTYVIDIKKSTVLSGAAGN